MQLKLPIYYNSLKMKGVTSSKYIFINLYIVTGIIVKHQTTQ